MRGPRRLPMPAPGPMLLVACACAVLTARQASRAAALRFLREDTEVARLDADVLKSECTPQTITVDDPYYERQVRYVACPLREVLRLGLGEAAGALPRPGPASPVPS